MPITKSKLSLCAALCLGACATKTPDPTHVDGVDAYQPTATVPGGPDGRAAGEGAAGEGGGGAAGGASERGMDAGESVDVAPPTGRPASNPGNVLYEFGVVPNSKLPALSTAETSGDIGWVMDPMLGPVVRIRAVDSGQPKERAEVSFGQGILKNGQTIFIGWKAKLDLPHPDQAWRNIFQEKSHGSYKLNVPFCMRADANTLRLLNDSGRPFWTHALPLNTWFTIVMKIVYSDNPQVGSIEVWMDGQAQKLAGGTTVQHLPTWGGGLQDVHWGLYRRATVDGTDIHYLSHVRVASTQADATPPDRGGL